MVAPAANAHSPKAQRAPRKARKSVRRTSARHSRPTRTGDLRPTLAPDVRWKIDALLDARPDAAVILEDIVDALQEAAR